MHGVAAREASPGRLNERGNFEGEEERGGGRIDGRVSVHREEGEGGNGTHEAV